MKRFVRLFLVFSGLLFAVGLLWGLGNHPLCTAAHEQASISRPIVLGNSNTTLRTLAAGDLDLDGDLDLVSTGLLAWENPSTPLATNWTSITLAGGVDAWDVTLGDLDRDGDLDAVAGGAFGLALYQNPLDGGAGTPFGSWTISHVLTSSAAIVNEVVAVDLDHDGWLDVAAVGGYVPGEGWLRIWQNPGTLTGTWPCQAITSTLGWQALAAADLDHDGWTDLVAGKGTYGVGLGVWAWRNPHNPFAETWADNRIVVLADETSSIALADLDGDSWLDVAVGYEQDTWGKVGLWRNAGHPFDGEWTSTESMNALYRVGSVTAGDLDRDGKVELATASDPTAQEVCWWDHDGYPFLDPWTRSQWLDEGAQAHDLLLADLDSDGDLDTVVAEENAILVWPNVRAAPLFPEIGDSPALGDPADPVYALAVGDLDWDGDPDLVTTGLLAWRNPGFGAFSGPWSSVPVAAGIEAWDAELADMDHDGDLDVVAAGPFGVSVWENPHDGVADPFLPGTWTVRHVLTTSQVLIFDLAVSDLDRDGWLDVTAVRGNSTTSGWLCAWRNPHNLAAHWTANMITETYGLEVLEVADLDRDGWDDLATGSGLYSLAYEVRAWQNDHTPFDGVWSSQQVADTGDDVRDIVLADLDGDGLLDVAARFDQMTAGALGLWRNPGNPFLQAWSESVSVTAGSRVSSLATGDLDHDGDLDLVDVEYGESWPPAGGARWWENDGTPFDGPWSKDEAYVPGTGLYEVALADLDGDGHLEAVAGGVGSPEIRVLRRQSAAKSFTYPVHDVPLGRVELALSTVGAADLDGDGDLDLVTDGLLAWEHPDGETFTATWVSSTLQEGIEANDVVLYDLDLDGDPDLVAGGTSGLAVWQNPLTQTASTPFSAWTVSDVLTTSAPVQAIAVALLDGDPYPDIISARDDLLLSGGSGDLVVWHNPGAFGGVWSMNVLTDLQGIHALSVGDLDGDDDVDLSTGSAYPATVHEVRVWENDGTPFAGDWQSWQVVDLFLEGGSDANDLVLADLDDDNLPDLAVGYQVNTGGALGLWQNLGTPFTQTWSISSTMTSGGRAWRVAAGDLDRDGRTDLVSAAAFSYTGNELAWWRNDGTPFDGAWASTWRIEPSMADLLLADLEGDGALETVILRQGSTELVAWRELLEHVYLPVVMRGWGGP